MVTIEPTSRDTTSFSSERFNLLLNQHPYFKHRYTGRKAEFGRFIPDAEQRMLDADPSTTMRRQFNGKLNHVSVANWLDKDMRPRHLDTIVSILLNEMSISSSKMDVIAWLTLDIDEIDLTPRRTTETTMDLASQAAMFRTVHDEARNLGFDYEALSIETVNALYEMVKQCWHLPDEHRAIAVKAIVQVFKLLMPDLQKKATKSEKIVEHITVIVNQLSTP